jgi:hypothetical protein
MVLGGANGLTKLGFDKEIVERLTGVKNWIHYSKDPKAGEVANIIEDVFGTGTVKGLAEDYAAKSGYGSGDFDIVLNKINIGVKTGGAKGAISQAVKEMGQSLLNDKKYTFISFDKKFKGSVK